MDTETSSPKSFTRSGLPWVVALLALVVYGVTLNRWVSFNSLEPTTLALGIDWWGYRVGYPLLYAVADIVRLVPSSMQILALNAVSAICASLTLALLVRTVAILPQDQTNDQRLRNTDPQSILSQPTDWLPPVFAVFVCGFQLTFWEHATVATGEMINLLLFAYVIRCLAEHRLAESDVWLYRAVFVYGLGIAANWAMVGFLPLFGFALLWIKKLGLFQPRFLLRALGLGLIGMLFYLYDPAIAALDKAETKTFWEFLTFEFVSQRNPLLGMPKGRVILLSVTSVVPLLLIAVKWPANFGDVSGSGVAIAGFLIRIVHVVFMAAIIWVCFDPVFSPRELGYGLPMMTFYYLGALAVGYLAGYFLLTCGAEPAKRWQRSTGIGKLLNRVLLFGLWAALLAVPVLLLRQNLPAIRVENGDHLWRYADQVAKDLPQKKVMLIGDDTRRLKLMAAHFHAHGKKHLLVPMPVMPEPRTHIRAAARYPGEWPDPGDVSKALPATAEAIVRFLVGMSGGYPLWRIDTGYGSALMEALDSEPRGLLFELRRAGGGRPTAEVGREDATRLADEFATLTAVRPSLREDLASRSSSAEKLARIYSGWANGLGVRLQISGDFTNAHTSFSAALEFNTNNVCAAINLDVAKALQEGRPGLSPNIGQLEQGVYELRSLGNVLRTHGPIDESAARAYFGTLLKDAKMWRQSVKEFGRGIELNPTNYAARFLMAETFFDARMLDECEAALAAAKATASSNKPPGFDSEYDRQWGLLAFGRGRRADAERRLTAALARDDSNTGLMQALVSVYIGTDRYEDALPLLNRQLEADPKHEEARFNLGAVYAKLQRHEDAIELLSDLLKEQTNNPALHVNRALAYQGLKKPEEARKDYERALQLKPRFHVAHIGLADLAEAAGDRERAKLRLQTALGLVHPDSRYAQRIRERLAGLGVDAGASTNALPTSPDK